MIKMYKQALLASLQASMNMLTQQRIQLLSTRKDKTVFHYKYSVSCTESFPMAQCGGESQSRKFLIRDVKIILIFLAHFCILMPSNYFIIFLLKKSRMYIIRATRIYICGPIEYSVQPLAMGWTVRGSNPGGGEILRTCQNWPWGPPSLLYNGYRVFPEGKAWLRHDIDPPTPSSAVVKKEQSYNSTPPMGHTACTEPQCLYSTAIPLLPLWAIRPVQCISACTVEL